MRPSQIPILLRPQAAAVVGGVSTLVQTTGKKTVEASTNATDSFVFPSNLTPGNTVVICITTYQKSHLTPTGIACGVDAMTKDTTLQMSGSADPNYWLSIWRKSGVTGGSATVTVTWDPGDLSESYFCASAEEWSGWQVSPLDRVPTPIEDTSFSFSPSITSAVTTQAKEVVYAAASVRGIEGTLLAGGPSSGFTQTVLENSGTLRPLAAGYKQVAATGAQTATFSNSAGSAAYFEMVMVTYKVN